MDAAVHDAGSMHAAVHDAVPVEKRGTCGRIVCGDRRTFARTFTYARLHFCYLTLLGVLGAVVLFSVERQNVRFIDALFTCVSAVCCVGLTTLDLSTLTIASQVVLWVLVQVGCIVLTSTVPVLIRRHYFAKTMKEALRSLGMNEKECDRLLRQELEYRALGWVLTIAFVHMLFWPLLMAIVWGLYFTNNDSARAPLDAGNVNPWWWSFFMATAATHNAGFSLLADNLVQFASNTFFLLSASLLILVGNIGYPLVMYGNVYLLHRIYGAKEPAFAFLLARPRKCFTHLFNRASTLILLGVMVFTTFFEFFLFLALDYNEAYIQSFPPPVRALVGWFQAISTRCAGFNSIDIGQTAPAMQLVYAVMMYLTVYPFALTIRRSADMDAAAEAAGLPALLAHPEPSGASAASSEAGNGTTPAGTASSGQQLSQQAVARELEATQAAELARLAQAISIAQRASGLGSGGSVALRTVGPGSLSNVTFADTGSFRLRSGGSFRKGGTKGDAADAADEVASVAESSILYDEFGHPLPPPPPVQTLRKEASGMFSRELFWLFTMLLAITISETNSIRDNAHPTYFNIFTVLFELSSAFGGVGLSIGYPGSPLSLSGQFNTFSKLVLIVAILAGRQRGLPTSIDPAVYLPALLSTKEAAEATSTAPDAAAAVQSLVQMSVQMFDAGRRRPMASIRSIFGPQAVASGKQTPTAGATDGAGTRATLFPRVGGGTTPRLAEPKLAGAASPRLRPQMHVTAPFTAVVVSVPGGGATPSHGNAPEPTGGAAGTVDADAAGASSISAQGVNSAAHGPSADATDMPELSLDS